MLYDIDKVRFINDHLLYLHFEDGTEGRLDIAKLIPFKGVFAPLKNEKYFSQVKLDKTLGTICWPNGADIAPEFLYDHLKS